MSTLSKSIVLNMSDMFEKIVAVKVSAKTGFGFNELIKVLDFKFEIKWLFTFYDKIKLL